jgi:DinB superfamily
MAFNLEHAIQVLERTPPVLAAMLSGLDDSWTMRNEGGDTWSAYDVIGHLIHGEHTDWIPRLDIILGDRPDKRFTPFDRFAQFRESEGKSLRRLLDDFTEARAKNVRSLRARHLTEADLDLTGIHPKFGTVTARQLLATWVAHDLDHVMQISRVMACQIGDEVGPWIEFLRIVRDKI